MNAGENVVTHLLKCVKLMKSEEFSASDLGFIKQVLEKMLTATNKAIAKTIK